MNSLVSRICRRSNVGLLILLGLFVSLFPIRVTPAQERASTPIYVILWLDTEDYISPGSDDSAKRLADFLTQQGIRATFKVVGEKARTLERRGRQDVIRALAQHEIGYHSNTHSQHPIVEEYEEILSWDDGIEEFARREGRGFDDVRRIFGKSPSCYGQPGSSWAPQPFPVLKKWGVKVYLDDGEHVGLDGKPFWYGGLLNIFNLPETSRLRPDPDWSNLEAAKANFEKFHSRMVSQEGGGIISIYYHPWEFIYRQPWDFTNFSDGADPPPDAWKASPRRSLEDIERAFNYFQNFILHIKSSPNVEFVTASQASELFPDTARGRAFSATELGAVAGRINSEVTFQVRDDYTLAPSEELSLLSQFVVAAIQKKALGPVTLEDTPYGPSSHLIEFKDGIQVPWHQFARAAVDVQDFLEKNRRVPNTVWFGSRAVPPESYLVALARVTETLRTTEAPPDSVLVAPARLETARYVSGDPGVWYWPVNPKGFRAPNLSALAKLQAWTLKPALLGHSH